MAKEGKAYKKRVIHESSDEDSDGNDPPPVAKRAKADETVPVAVAPAVKDIEMKNLAPEAKPVSKTKPKQQAVVEDKDGDDAPLANKLVAEKLQEKKNKEVKEKKSTNGKVKNDEPNNDDDDDVPLAIKARPPILPPAAKQESKSKPAKKKSVKKQASSDDDDVTMNGNDDEADSDVPLASSIAEKKPKKAKAAPKPKNQAAKKEPDASSPVKPKKSAAKGKGKATKKEEKNDDNEEEAKSDAGSEDSEVFNWWDGNDEDGTKIGDGPKWKTLEHNGVMFPPEYEPHGVKMKYNGKSVDLPPEAEEVASFFAAILATDNAKNPVFVKNFFSSWLEVMNTHPPRNNVKIEKFTLCDFNPIFEHLEAVKQKKKSMTSAEKKLMKAAKDIEEEAYKTCLLDGRKEKVGNFRVEPPGLFRGRGAHPKTGLLKTRLSPEQITINIGEGAKVPVPPAGHSWNKVTHDKNVTWLATWKENINGAVKYVFLAAGSSLKGQSDFKKFEKARALKSHVERIRADYNADLTNREMAIRQRATAIYLIDRFALRNGNEKGEDSADTVGCCSLRFEHVTLTPPSKVTFDFLGKDSIRYVNEVEVDDRVFKNLKIFKKEPKVVGDLLFDRLTTTIVNKYLTNYMDGLTAKVFRTYNASWTFVQQLADTPKDATLADKLLHYNRANRMVAILCNHQKSVSKGHIASMDKLSDKLKQHKFGRKKARAQLFATAGNKKKYKQFAEDESDLDDDWIVSHEAALLVQEKEKITKKFEKDNKALVAKAEPEMAESELKERLKGVKVLEKKLKDERANGWTTTSKLSDDKLVALIEKTDEKIALAKVNALDKDEGKEISLGTSIQNYIDPRITFSWCKKHDVPPSKMLSKTLIEKFTWAASTDESFDW